MLCSNVSSYQALENQFEKANNRIQGLREKNRSLKLNQETLQLSVDESSRAIEQFQNQGQLKDNEILNLKYEKRQVDRKLADLEAQFTQKQSDT